MAQIVKFSHDPEKAKVLVDADYEGLYVLPRTHVTRFSLALKGGHRLELDEGEAIRLAEAILNSSLASDVLMGAMMGEVTDDYLAHINARRKAIKIKPLRMEQVRKIRETYLLAFFKEDV